MAQDRERCCRAIARIDFEGAIEQTDGLSNALAGHLVVVQVGAQIMVVGAEIVRPARRQVDLDLQQFRLNR